MFVKLPKPSTAAGFICEHFKIWCKMQCLGKCAARVINTTCTITLYAPNYPPQWSCSYFQHPFLLPCVAAKLASQDPIYVVCVIQGQTSAFCSSAFCSPQLWLSHRQQNMQNDTPNSIIWNSHLTRDKQIMAMLLQQDCMVMMIRHKIWQWSAIKIQRIVEFFNFTGIFNFTWFS